MVLMDPFKAYCYLPPDLLIAKLADNGFGPNGLALTANYNLCQKSLEHLLNNEVYLTIANFRSNLTATDPLPP